MAVLNYHFYNQGLRKYIVMFGNMFDGMSVQRLNANNNVVQTIAVPISYGPKEKFLARLSADPALNRPIAVQLPAMSFEIVNMQYDGSRRLQHTNKLVAQGSVPATLTSTYTPVPWNLNFNLYIFIRNADDGAQLLEQILPFFGPEWTNKVNVIPSMNLVMDIPTVLTGVNTEDVYEGGFDIRRSLIYTLSFVVKGYFYGPVRTNGSRNKVIKRIQIDFGIPPTNNNNSTMLITDSEAANTGRSSRVVITPGLLANGSPTTNSAASINYQLISANSNYGIASNTYFFVDGLHYNPATGQDE